MTVVAIAAGAPNFSNDLFRGKETHMKNDSHVMKNMKPVREEYHASILIESVKFQTNQKRHQYCYTDPETDNCATVKLLSSFIMRRL